ncbi:MAG: NUDIX hydrolase [Candidatus Moranbacteria bacterium]|jgi:ADP-ribose pyrophosphatase|nr:NUDIX hydrolase [Candidatus Moranbacteria bacterium]MDD5652361.1 NUDIX hydrolase [Candidatus Moranbacteria bacterium]MDX9855708.1 NUDIX hydrolase [Candidatus Moranbacteria bacterium]
MPDKARKWKELSRKIAFQKYGRKIEKVVYRFPDGKESDFYIKKEGPTVCVLAFTKKNEVILAKQFRPGPKEILLELPGGGIEKGESFKQAVERELLEETGYKGKTVFVAEALDCAYSTMRRRCFVATDCEKVAEPQNTSSEICETILLPLDEFRDLLRSGKMTDIEVAYIGLDHLGLL